jgi:uncharacterized repeat protein (TIGR02543 family)
MKTKNFGRKLAAFIAAVVVAVGAITTGTVLLLKKNKELQNNENPAAAVTAWDFMKPVAGIPTRFQGGVPSTHYVELGEYPQTHVKETDLINNLTDYARPTGYKYLVNGNPTDDWAQTWQETLLTEYILDGEKYVHMPAPKPDGTATLSTGTSINTSSTNLWFKVEPLLWYVMNKLDIDAGTTSTMNLLAVNNIIAGIPFHGYYDGPYTYYNSGIRVFLGGGTSTNPSFTVDGNKSFFQTAFNTTARSLINSNVIDNITDSGYTDSADQNTVDRVYLPSYNDMTTAPFTTSQSDSKRSAVTTDFAFANYANTRDTFLRSKNGYSSSYEQLYHISSGGFLGYQYINYAVHGYRPAMRISLSALASVSSVESLTRGFVSYSYDLNGGTGTPPAGGTVMVDGTITLPPASAAGTRAEHVFAGWGINNSTSPTHGAGATATITGTSTIYAIWSPSLYNILYYLEGGSWTRGQQAVWHLFQYNSINGVVLPTVEDVTRTGYTFLRWREGSVTGPVVTAIPPGSTKGDKSYYAEWGYDINTYNAAIAAKNAEISKLTGERDTAIGERDSLQILLNNKTQELADKTIEYNNLLADYEAMESQFNANWEAEKEGYQAEIKRLEDEIEDWLELIGDLGKDIEALNGRITVLEKDIEDHKDDYEKGFLSYVNEYELITWKVLQDNETAAGPLTTYAQYGEKVRVPYDSTIEAVTLPQELRTVQSKQYTYTFSHWSLTPQTGEKPNPEAPFPSTRDATDVIYYAQYERAEREYTVTWIIPDDRLDYTDGNATKIQVTYKYGDAITSLALTEIHGAGVNYLPNGWAATQGGAKIMDFGKCMGARTFYARYTIHPTV